MEPVYSEARHAAGEPKQDTLEGSYAIYNYPERRLHGARRDDR